MTPWGSVLTGLIAGFTAVAAANFVDRKLLEIDDPVGAFAVHGACGIWGTLAIGLFAKYDDAFLGRDDAEIVLWRRIRSNRYASGSGHHRCCLDDCYWIHRVRRS